MRILAVVPEEKGRWIESTLIDEDVELFLIHSLEGVKPVNRSSCDLVILDSQLEGLEESLFLASLVRSIDKPPIVSLSDRRGEPAWANAAIIMPSEGDRLIMCIYELTGFSRGQPFILTSGEFTLEFNRRWLKINGERVRLGRLEFRIIDLLARHRGEIFSKSALYRHLYSDRSEEGIKIIDVYLDHARRIIRGTTKGHSFIETVFEKGYRFGEVEADT